MISTLSPKTNSAMNATTPTSTGRGTSYRTRTYEPSPGSTSDDFEDAHSSPFVAEVNDHQRENISPIKLPKSSTPVDQGPLSPLKMLKARATPNPNRNSMAERSPRKISAPEKRFPVKVRVPSPERAPQQEQTVTMSEVLRDNEGLTKAIEILEDEYSVLHYSQKTESLDFGNDTIRSVEEEDAEHEGFADETAFSNFSAVPDMTMFAKIGHSPSKSVVLGQTPRKNPISTPATSRLQSYDAEGSPSSPTPRGHQGHSVAHSYDGGNTTNLILDFTEQFNSVSGNIESSRRGGISPSKTLPDLLSYTQNARTPSPSKHRQQIHSPVNRMSNLLDFDIPPAPTPRSMPSITPRELESLKSGFLSEISSLKASLSGKEAEVSHLKSAVGDAEKRVGETMEQVREERNAKEELALEKESWEKRGREMEALLRNVKDEIVHGERERENLEGRLAESEGRREAAEMMAQEAESKMAAVRAGSSPSGETGDSEKRPTSESTGREVEVAVEKVARELHTLYKSKHETKVSALKKSYESRWERKIKDLEAKIDEISRENEELKVGGNATMSHVIPRLPVSEVTEEMKEQAARDAQAAKELEARVEGLVHEINSIKRDNGELRQELDQERVEKGELISLCDEFLRLGATVEQAQPAVPVAVESFRNSMSRPSGLRAPRPTSTIITSGTPNGQSRIAKMGERTRSGSAQGARPGSGLAMRSGIMSSIEKMGSYKGRAE